MQEKGNIEELFINAFDQFEEPVRPELWSRISGKLNPAAPQADMTSAAKQVTGISKIISGGGLWIAGAAIVVTTAAVFYLQPTDQSVTTTPDAVVENIAVPQTNEETHVDLQASESLQDATTLLTSPVKRQEVVTSTSSSTDNKPSEPVAVADAIIQENQKTNGAEIHSENTAPANGNQYINSSQPVSGSASTSDAEPAHDSSTDSQRPVLQVFPLTGTAPLTVSCLFSGAAESASWNLGDGTIIDNQKPFNHTFTAPGVYQLTLTTTDQNGKKHHAFTEIVVKSDNLLSNIPNIFTPNGDGRNDLFKIESDKDIDFEATIIDKSGKTIYSWKGIENGWDGKLSSGADAEKGTYFYVIFATASDKIKHTYKGTLTLIR